MITYDDIKIGTYECGLTLLTGREIKEVRGYLSQEFGDAVFKVTEIEFEDGSHIDVEGEHDIPYLSPYDDTPNMDSDTLNRLCDEQDNDLIPGDVEEIPF